MHEYDEGGRIVRSTTVTEPEWDEQERAWMLALAAYEASLCPACGRHLSICTDPKNEGRVRVDPPTRCHFTTAVVHAREPYHKAKAAEALMFTAHLA